MNPLGILFNYVTSVIGSLLSIGLFTLIVKLTSIPLKRLTVDKEAIYIAVGIRPDGAFNSNINFNRKYMIITVNNKNGLRALSLLISLILNT